jgi:hypothetical protein
MSERIDHDRLFKELISTFFIEFIELFFPEVLKYIDINSVSLLDKEIFTDVTAGDKYETDLIAKVRFSVNLLTFSFTLKPNQEQNRNLIKECSVIFPDYTKNLTYQFIP